MSNYPEKTPEYYRIEYFRRVHKAIDFLDANLGRDVALDELATVACFSKFHFHRIFKEVTGETVGQYALRLRLQRAASQLIFNRSMNVTDIAYECGFAESSVFSRSFRQFFGMSPSEWRKSSHGTIANLPREANGNLCHSIAQVTGQPDWNCAKPTWTMDVAGIGKSPVTVEDFPDLTVASVRHVGCYSDICGVFETLFAWAGPRGLFTPSSLVLGIYYDMPEASEEDKMRSDACITVPAGTTGEGPVIVKTIATKGAYACGHFDFHDKEGFHNAWNAMMGTWLPQSGYQCDERPTFELYRNDCKDDHFIVDICVPVRPL